MSSIRKGMATCMLLVSLLLLSRGAAADVTGCGGFVQASPSLVKLRSPSEPKPDYSHIKVELLSEEGLVKDSTECAPNGYYFLPVYDKGSFFVSVKGPDGWAFEPSKVPVKVDSESCNDNQDINFQYTGFSLSGMVLGAVGGKSCKAAADQGPADVKVIATPVLPPGKEAENSRVVETWTSEGGQFHFSNMSTGEYDLAVWHPFWVVETSSSVRVRVQWGGSHFPDVFRLAGYDLRGSVVAQGSPVPGVEFFLYSNDVKSIPCASSVYVSPLEGRKPLCQASSGPDGTFLFPTVPCGAYEVVPSYRGEATVFDVSPARVGLDVGHGSASLDTPFQVTGFSVGGMVVDHEGEGVEGADVAVDGTKRATTDEQGVYKLDQVESATYTISASKPGYTFVSLEKISVLPNEPILPDITASTYSLCGQLSFDGSSFPAQRQVALTHGPESVLPQSRPSAEDGSFCFQVPPGEYRVTPAVNAAEAAAGLLFSPSYADVKVKAAPVDRVHFKQSSLSISGRVKCLEGCNSSVTVTLAPESGRGAVQNLSLEESSSLFKFTGVVPGKYLMQVKKEAPENSTLLGDTWCWEASSKHVEVTNQDVTGIVFKQKGWLMQVNASHPVKGFLMHDKVDPFEVPLKAGMNEICLSVSGTHMLMFMYSCVYFGAFMHSFDTAYPETLQLQAQAFLLEGTITVDSRHIPHASNYSDYFFPAIFMEDGTPVDQRSFASLKDKANESHPLAVYEFAHWGQFGDHFLFEPYHNGKVQPEVKTAEDYAAEMERETEAENARKSSKDSEQEEDPGSLMSFFEQVAAQNPAVLGKVVDVEELQKKYGKDTLQTNVPPAPELPDNTTFPEEEVVDEEEIRPVDYVVTPEEEEYYRQQQVVDPYEHLPVQARPWPEEEETFPPVRRFLFYPRFQKVAIDAEGCSPPIPNFVARPGVYLEGQVEPPLAGVTIRVIATSDSESTGHKPGDVVLVTETQEQGLYVAGPLYDDSTYSVRAEKEGFSFRPLGDFSFQAEKLGQINVSITRGPGAEATLPPVLLSLSGEQGYRNNAPTPPGEGFLFDNLFPGSFYLRPLLKEYSFTPSKVAIELASGESKEVSFEATRVAFGVLGSVQSLAGKPEEGVPLEARSLTGGLYESTTTDVNGTYRLRGLVPGHSYTVQVALKNGSEGYSRIERASPTSVTVHVKEEDTGGVNFLVFDQVPGTITGTVEGSDIDKWQPHLSVEVVQAANPGGPVERSIPVPISHFFEIRDLPRGSYLVRLHLGLSDQSLQFQAEPAAADLRHEAVQHVGALSFSASQNQPPQELTTAAALPIVLSIVVIALFASLSRLKDAFASLTRSSSTAGSQAGGGWVVSPPGERKVKQETKKAAQRIRTY